jgi:hypothetical protein
MSKKIYETTKGHTQQYLKILKATLLLSNDYSLQICLEYTIFTLNMEEKWKKILRKLFDVIYVEFHKDGIFYWNRHSNGIFDIYWLAANISEGRGKNVIFGDIKNMSSAMF